LLEREGRPVYYDIIDRPSMKITTKLSSQVRKWREFYPYTCEANVLVYDRFLIDKDIYIGYKTEGGIRGCEALGIEPKIMYFDIETSIHPEYDRAGGVWPIVSIQCSSNWSWDIMVFVLDPFNKYPNDYTYVLGDRSEDKLVKERVGLDVDEFIINAKVIRFRTEKELLKGWLRFLRAEDPDFLETWYGNYYDIPEIMKALVRNNIDIRWLSNVFNNERRNDPAFSKIVAFPEERERRGKYQQRQFPHILGRECIDMLDLYKKINITSQRIIVSWDFKDVCRDEMGLVYEDIAEKMREYHLNRPMESTHYMVLEAMALKMLDMVIGQTEHFHSYREIFGVRMKDTLSFNYCYKILLLRLTTNPLPTVSPSTFRSQKGGKVIRPAKKGLMRWVAVLDFRALYPFLMGEENPGLETFMERTDRIAIFTKTKKALMVQAMERPRDKREELRQQQREIDPNDPYGDFLKKKLKRKEASMKSAANSAYGVSGYKNNPVYSWEANQKVTFEAREALTWMIDELEEVLFEIVYADTDGVGVTLDIFKNTEGEWTLDDYIEAALLLKDFVNYKVREYAKERGWSKPPEIKLEKIAKTMMFQFKRGEDILAKKRYVMYVVWEDGFKVKKIVNMGTESKRSNTSNVTRRMLDDFYYIMLEEEDIPKAMKMIKDTYNSVLDGVVNQWDIAVPCGLETENPNYWVRKAVNYAIEHLNQTYNRNMKPRILYVNNVEGKPPTKHLAIVNDNVYDEDVIAIDYRTTAEKIVINKIEPFLRSLDYSTEGLLKGQLQLDQWGL